VKNNWETKKLGEVLEKTETINPELYPENEYKYVDISSVSNKTFSIENVSIIKGKNAPSRARKKMRSGDIIFATVRPTLKRLATIPEHLDGQVCSTGFFIIRNKKMINKSLLFYFLLTDEFNKNMEKLQRGTSYPAVTDSDIKNQNITFPESLSEQQRIVAILDKTFAAIDKAKFNAERNLKNAKELFESYLQMVFESKSKNWEKQNVKDCFKLKSGDGLTSKNMSKDGRYPVFGGNGVAGLHNAYNLSGSNIIIGRVGALCGNVRHVNQNIWLTDNAFKIVDYQFDFDHSFLVYLLNYKNLRDFARQAAQPVISNSSLKTLMLKFPKSLKIQQDIVKKLDDLSEKITKLELIYRNEIIQLDTLKKSILQKAFSGELTTENIDIDTQVQA
jgi:type I restriction enzyme, S subunit